MVLLFYMMLNITNHINILDITGLKNETANVVMSIMTIILIMILCIVQCYKRVRKAIKL